MLACSTTNRAYSVHYSGDGGGGGGAIMVNKK